MADHIPATGSASPGDGSAEPTPPARSRRSFLTAAVAALGAAAAQSAISVVPAHAANGDGVKAGRTSSATAVTTFRNSGKGGVALKGYASSTGSSSDSAGVVGQSGARDGTGVVGIASAAGGTGVMGEGEEVGVDGEGRSIGVTGYATGAEGTGIHGLADGRASIGVQGEGRGANGIGVDGFGTTGVHGSSVLEHGVGVSGEAAGGQGIGVQGDANVRLGIGVYGRSTNASGTGVMGVATGSQGVGIYGSPGSTGRWAGYFVGDVYLKGALFGDSPATLADHPLAPAERYLAHALVSSPEVLNVYSGSVRLDAKGRATVRLPRYYEAYNAEHRVQLTPVGAAAPDLHLAREVKGNRFVIAGGVAGQNVYWQVTGVRDDASARTHRRKVDTAKRGADKGRYVDPAAFGKARRLSVGRPPR